jgi:hypothetical protein
MIKIIYCTVLSLTFISCIYNEDIKVKFKNDSKTEIKNIKFSAENGTKSSPKINVDILEIGDEKYNTLNMKNLVKNDGSYSLDYIKDGKNKVISSGYFTNGRPTGSSVLITFEKDTVLFNYKN